MTLEWPGLPDVVAREVDDLPDHLPGGDEIGPGMETAKDTLFISLPGVARALVRGGNTVDYRIEPGADPDLARRLFRGSARAALMHQRGDIPLNGTALCASNGTAVVLCGLSVTGKSTLAYELTRRGWTLLADGIACIANAMPRAQIHPADTSIELWAAACEHFGIDTAPLRRVRSRLQKYEVPVDAATQSAPLSVVVEVIPEGRAALVQVRGAERMNVLSRNSFRPRLIEAMGLIPAHSHTGARVLTTARVFQLYGATLSPVEELAGYVAGLVR